MSDPVLIQPVESPVICRPYYEPTRYWAYDKNTGRAQNVEGRRPASYWYKDPSADIRRGQMTLELEEDRHDLVCVNPDAIHRWAKRKEMHTHRVGRLWKFEATEVDEWVREGKAAEMQNG